MSDIQYSLYLDESGQFEDDQLRKGYSPSLVGGLLVRSDRVPEDQLRGLVGHFIHGCENYDQHKEEYLSILSKLQEWEGRFVIFENSERLKIIDTDVTYLNIISEGLVRLFRDLAVRHTGRKIAVNVHIAKRTDVSELNKGGKPGWIQNPEYTDRLEEKLILSMGRNGVSGVQYQLTFGNARHDQLLMLADLICNTWLTRKALRFKAEDRAKIREWYKQEYRYTVFENATIGYIKRLYIEQRYGEMIYQMCLLKDEEAVTPLCDMLLQRLAALSYGEQMHIFTVMRAQIGRHNSSHLYEAGICFALNYIRYILDRAEENGIRRQIVDYWRFDTDFFILSMYEHQGNAGKCAEYIALCRKEIKNVPANMDQMAYRFNYRLRELNALMGTFDFRGVIEECDRLAGVFGEAKRFFDRVAEYEETVVRAGSDLMGKAYGTKLHAMINLVSRDPSLLEEALKLSEMAEAEFSGIEDRKRQMQLRCQLYTAAGWAKEATEWLYRSMEIDPADEQRDEIYVAKACIAPDRINTFALLHYTNVCALLSAQGDRNGYTMLDKLNANGNFKSFSLNDTEAEYPMNMIWRNIFCCMLDSGTPMEQCIMYYDRAIRMITRDPRRTTLRTYGICLAADRLLRCRKLRLPAEKAEKDLSLFLAMLSWKDIPAAIQAWFGPAAVPAEMTDEQLLRLSGSYMK